MAITVRKASLQDFINVRKITKKSIIYSGFDYLPPAYESILTRHGGYVLEIDDQVVGFLGYIITDGGTSFIPIGGRIHDDFKNQGLFRFLMDSVTKALCAALPQISSRRMSINMSNPHAKKLISLHSVVCRGKHVRMTMDEVRRKHFSHFLSMLEDPSRAETVVEMTIGDICGVMDSPQFVQNLFPGGYIFHDWRVYRFVRVEMESLVVEHSNFHFVSFRSSDCRSSQTTSAVAMVSTNEYGDDKGIKLNLDFYGDIDENIFKSLLGKAMRMMDKDAIRYDALQVVVPYRY